MIIKLSYIIWNKNIYVSWIIIELFQKNWNTDNAFENIFWAPKNNLTEIETIYKLIECIILNTQKEQEISQIKSGIIYGSFYDFIKLNEQEK